MRTLEESFNYLERKKEISYEELISEFKNVGIALIGLILVLPSALPIPSTYYSTPIGIIIFFIGLSIMIDKNVISKKYSKKKIKINNLKKIHRKINFLIRFFDKISKKRMNFLFNRYLLGFFIIILGLTMVIPYPFTDTLPAISLLIIFFSMINDDGLFLLFGFFLGIFSLFVAYIALRYGYIIIKEIIILIKNFFYH